MKRTCLFFITLCMFIASLSVIYAAPLDGININTTNMLGYFKLDEIKVKQYVGNAEWTWIEVDLFDEKYPLTIDVLFNSKDAPSRVAYLVAPSAYNFRCNYFTPQSNNIAHFMRRNDYLVIGITFREDHLPPDQVDQSILQWGLAKHRSDMNKIISAIQHYIRLPYELLGQSSSAVCILDYAAHYSDPKFEKIILLDTDSFEPGSEKVDKAKLTYGALGQLIDQGIYVNPFTRSFRDLIFAAMLYPDADSGQARPGLPGNFTLNGLLHFSLINTAFLPGMHTPITGLPGEWVMIQGVAAGYYSFNPDPLLDNFILHLTDVNILPLVASEMGEGVSPLAFERDIYGVLALDGTYTIDWAGIQEKVVMINGQYSSGNQVYYGTLIQNAGNSNVVINVIPGYAYVDLLYGRNAEQDVWQHFLD